MAITYNDLATLLKQIYVLRSPTISLSKLTQVAMTYNDHSHQIKTNIYVTPPKCEILNLHFENIIQWDLTKDTHHYHVQHYSWGHDL